MISKNEIKLIRSLKSKKYRDKSNLFVAEGEKLVEHLIKGGFEFQKVFAVAGTRLSGVSSWEEVSEKEMGQITHFNSPSSTLAILIKRKECSTFVDGRTLVLDDIRDPGNLGTIIRLADWFGIQQLLCSPQTVDVYNSKVVASTMGSLANVQIVYTELTSALSEMKQRNISLIGTLMDGTNSHEYDWPESFALIMGNEANGISKEVEALLDVALTIPKAPTASAESLNVAMATAVLLAGV